MYRKMDEQISFLEYYKEDIFTLNPNNRWIKKAQLVPWEKAEAKYMHMFCKHGRPAKHIRMALGALIIQQTLKISDEETVEQITENPYLQSFVGLKEYTSEKPFDPSLMVWFRKRLSAKFMAELNDEMCRREAQPEKDNQDDDTPHGGTLILDATCSPADITYPTDTGLLEKAIEKTDEIIDKLHKPNKGKQRRPRTYRLKSRQLFVGFTKQRRPKAKTIRQCIRRQLGFLKRNIGFIEQMLKSNRNLSIKQQEQYETIKTLYAQQLEMYQQKKHTVPDRIVSLTQPHIRPIVRGKASARVEFGAKLAISIVKGYTYIDKICFDNFNEGTLLLTCLENYRERFGMLPKVVLADTIYRNRDNLRYCKEAGIRLSGKALGKPPKNRVGQKALEKRDTAARNEIEGKIGHLKNDYGLRKITARLPETSEAVIAVAIFAMNLSKKVKSFLWQILSFLLLPNFRYQIADC